MIDLAFADTLFEKGIHLCLFDKRFLIPLSRLPGVIQTETGESITTAELQLMGEQGLLPLLAGAGADGDEIGAPFYAPSRAGEFLKLRRKGYSDEELRAYADFEEYWIDNVLTRDDLAYEDDDLETLIVHTKERVDALQYGSTTDSEGHPIDRSADLVEEEETLKILQAVQQVGMSEKLAHGIAQSAYRVRMLNEMIRLQTLNEDRALLKSGYSPYLCFRSHGWKAADGQFEYFHGNEIFWDSSIRAACAHVPEGEPPFIRLPGFLIRGDLVQPIETMSPRKYGRMWEEGNIDGYLDEWSKLTGERRCLECRDPLPSASDPRKRYCEEKCRNSAKQRRWRTNNPVAVHQANQKYYESCKQ